MPIFEMDEGRARLLQPMQPLASSFVGELRGLLNEHLAVVVGEPLFRIRSRAVLPDHADGPELLALDAAGNPVLVEAVQVVDDDVLVTVLRHAGSAARLTASDLARAYHADPTRFTTDYAGFREQVAFRPATADRPHVRVVLLCAEVAAETADALAALRAADARVTVLQVGVMRGSDDRRLLDVSPLAQHERARRPVEPTALRLVRAASGIGDERPGLGDERPSARYDGRSYAGLDERSGGVLDERSGGVLDERSSAHRDGDGRSGVSTAPIPAPHETPLPAVPPMPTVPPVPAASVAPVAPPVAPSVPARLTSHRAPADPTSIDLSYPGDPAAPAVPAPATPPSAVPANAAPPPVTPPPTTASPARLRPSAPVYAPVEPPTPRVEVPPDLMPSTAARYEAPARPAGPTPLTGVAASNGYSANSAPVADRHRVAEGTAPRGADQLSDRQWPLPELTTLAKRRQAVTLLVWVRERRGQRFEAMLRADGLIQLPDGSVFADPDVAAGRAAGVDGLVDGWRAWHLGAGGPTLAEAAGR